MSPKTVFIDPVSGDAGFGILKLADAGISGGAILLGFALWRRLRAAAPEGAR